jgi:glutathione S-transferase
MSGYVIFGDSNSGNCHKVKWTADILRLAYEWRETNVLDGGARTKEFLALNPVAQVPTIITPEGQPLAQSNAILLYLAERHGGGFIPHDALARARMYERLFFEQYSHEPYIAVRRFQKFYLKKNDNEIDPKLLERGEKALSLMQEFLSRAPWIAGDDFTLADISLIAYTRLSHEGGFDLGKFPLVRDWVVRAGRVLDIKD